MIDRTRTLLSVFFRLRGFYQFFILFSITAFLWQGQVAYAQINACDGGVITGESVLDAMGVPVGERTDGYWSETAGLNFSSLTNRYAIISGFTSGNNYTIEWTYKNESTRYSYNFTATNDALPPVGELEYDGTTNDVMLCTDADVSLDPNPDGYTSYEFFVRDNITKQERSITVHDDSNYNLTTANYAPLDEVFFVIERSNGCKRLSNDLVISNVSEIAVEVVDYVSACDINPVPPYERLRVLPNEPGLTYNWITPLGAVAGSGPIDIMANGDYYVEVSGVGGCAGIYTSNTITIGSGSLPTIDSIRGSNICGSHPAIINSYLSGGALGYSYEWLRNGSLDLSLGSASSISTDIEGDYQLRLYSTANPACYVMSNTESVVYNEITGATFTSQNGPFCSSDIAVNRIPEFAMTITGGSGTFTINYSANGIPQAPLIVTTEVPFALASDISITTTYHIDNITDVDGCDIDPALLPSDVTVTVYKLPDVQALDNTIDGCEGTSVTISLVNCEVGVTYTLRRNVSGVITDIESITPVAGGTLTFTTAPSTVGVYYVVATNGTCTEVNMTGMREIVAVPINYNLGVFETGPYCSGLNYHISLSGSETGTFYTLYRGAVAIETLAGDGNSLAFTAQSLAGTYIIRASNGVCPDEDMNGQLVINSTPAIYPLLGTDACSDLPFDVEISNSTAGITYNLYQNPGGGPVLAASVVSAGGPFSFGTFSGLGSYYATAVNTTTTCTSAASNSISLSDIPTDVPFVTSGQVCTSGTVALGTSDAGVDYQLRLDGIDIGAPIPGGGVVNFGVQSVAGAYTIFAENTTTNCSRLLSGSLEVQITPDNSFTLTANQNEYCTGASPTGVVLTLSDSETNVDYQLYDGSGAYGAPLNGTGGALTWSNVSAGTYYVRGTTAAGCGSGLTMSGSPTITTTALPTATISVLGGDNEKCDGEVKTFTIAVDLTGTFPFDFTIEDDKGNSFPIVGWATNQYTMVVNPSDTTIYTLTSFSDNSACTGVISGSAVIIVKPKPIVAIAGDLFICNGETTTLTASGSGVSYLWGTGAITPVVTVGPTATTNYTVTTIDANNCSESVTVSVTVNSLPVVSFSGFASPANYCVNSGAVALTGLPAGGSFSGSGISGSSFNPSVANVGSHAIFYSYTDINGCSSTTAEQTVNVLPLPIVDITELDTIYCADQGLVTLTGTPTGSNGSFTIPTVGANYVDNGDGTATFDPSASSPNQTYTVRYNYTDAFGCTNFIDKNLTVRPVHSVSFSGLPSNACQDDAAIVLTGSEAGAGTFTGNGITDNGNGTASFSPAAAGNGAHTITYTHTDGNGCTGTYSEIITIGDPLSLVGVNSLYCTSDAPFAIEGNYHPNGTITLRDGGGVVIETGLSGSVTFDPGVLAAGTYTIEYSYVGSCVNSKIWSVDVVALPDATFDTSTGIHTFCESVTSVTLVPTNSGGTFTGTVGGSAIFNPSAAGTGLHTVTYTLSTGSCTDSKSINIQVLPLPVVAITGLDASYCNNGSIDNISANNTGIAGAVYTITSTTDGLGNSPVTDNNDGTADFDPSVVAPGDYTVTYTFDNTANGGCINSVTQVARVYGATAVNFSSSIEPMEYCLDQATVTLTSTTGTGTFSGFGITDNTDGTASFNPSTAGTGTHIITYNYTAPVALGSCASSVQRNIEVLDIPTVYSITPDGASPTDGHFCLGGTGVTIGMADSEVGVNYHLILNGNTTAPEQTQAGDGDDIQFASAVTTVGVYTVVAEMVNGCTAMMNGSLTVVANNVSASVLKQNVLCNSSSSGEIVIAASGGSLNYVYSIDNGTTTQPSNTFSGLGAATYQVMVEDAIGCTLPASIPVIITEPAALSVSLVSTTGVGCTPCTAGVDCEGSATISISGGTPLYSIEWRDSGSNLVGTTVTATGLDVGNYTVTVTDANLCSQTIPVVTINPLPAMTITEDVAAHVNNSCFGDFSGEFKVDAIGGSGEYEFSVDQVNWFAEVNPADDSYTFSNLAAATYSVWVRDAQHIRCDLQLTGTITITQPSAVTVSLVSVTHISCFGETDGQIVVAGSGGSGTYQYSINGAVQASATFATLGAGTYSMRVIDLVNGCVSPPISVNVIEPPKINVSPVKVSDVKCFGGSNGIATVLASGGTGGLSYEWENIATPGSVMGTLDTINILPAGTFKIRVTDASGCKDSANISILQPESALIFSLSSTPVASCGCTSGTGTCEGTATITSITGGSIPYAISWSTGAGNQASISDLEPGIYSATVTDGNGCVLTNPVTVGTFGSLTLSEDILSRVNNTCNGDNAGEFTVVASGGSGKYQFSRDNATWFSSPTSNFTFTGLAQGTYNAWVRDSIYQRCAYQMTGNIMISSPAVLSLSVTGQDNITCNGGFNGSISVFAGGGSGVYDFTIDGGTNWFSSGTNSYTFSGLSESIYDIWVRDASATSCINNTLGSITLTQPPVLSVSLTSTNSTCNGADDGTITVNSNGGSGSYAYSIDAGVNWQLSGLFANLMPNNYTIIVADLADGSCTTSTSATIIEPSSIGATLKAGSQQNVNCFGQSTGAFEVEAVPVGASLEYSIDGINYYTSPKFQNLSAGIYDVSVRNGTCINTNVLQVTITEPAATLQIANAVVTPDTCATNSAGYAPDGTITVTVTGGTAPYSYNWKAVATNTPVGGNSNNITGLTEGDYSVTVTDASGDCSVSATYTVTQPADWSSTVAKTDVTVLGGNDGSINVGVTGGTGPVNIFWSDGATFDGLTTRNALAVGTYTFTAIDLVGCSYSEDVIITDGNALDVTIAKQTDVLCYEDSTGSIKITIANGTPLYSISWSGPVSGSVSDITNIYTLNTLPAGNYNIVVSDITGASVSDIITINQPSAPLSFSTLLAKSETCYNADDGEISIGVSGGAIAGNYDIDVLPGYSNISAINYTLSSLPPGNYVVYATDDNGCIEDTSVVVGAKNEILVSLSASTITCNGGADGIITTTITGRPLGTSYYYNWERLVSGIWTPYLLNGVTNKLTNVPADTFRVTVQPQAEVCTVVSAPVIVTENNSLNWIINTTNITGCNGDDTGAFEVFVSGGVPPYKLLYGNVNDTIFGIGPLLSRTGLTANSYNLTLSDANNCNLATTISISEPLLLTVSNVVDTISCDIEGTGYVSFDIAGGNVLGGNNQYYLLLEQNEGGAPYTSTVTVPAGSTYFHSFGNLNSGSYTLTVTDNYSSLPKCNEVVSFSLSLINITGTVTNTTCAGVNSGSITGVTISGTSADYTYAWGTVDGSGLIAGNLNQTGLSAGTYILSVTDNFRGCTVIKDFVITNNSTLSVSGAVNSISCNGNADGSIVGVSVFGATAPVSYLWNGPSALNVTTPELDFLAKGTYQLLVTDANGCSIIDSFVVDEPDPITFDLTTIIESCSPHSHAINLNNLTGGTPLFGSYNFSWLGPQAVTQTQNLTGLTVGGEYMVTVTDNNGCKAEDSIIISDPIKLSTNVTGLQCNGDTYGSIVLDVTGGSGNYTYQWNKDGVPFATTKDITGLDSAMYYVMVTDQLESDVTGQCFEDTFRIISHPDLIQITGITVEPYCAGDSTAAIYINVTGGTGNYSYNWTTGNGYGLIANAKNQSGLTKGLYNVVVTDDNSCSVNKDFTINESTPVAFDLDVTDTQCDGTSGSIEVINTAGGTAPYDVIWTGYSITPVYQGNALAANLEGGNYTATVIDANSCSLTKSVTLTKALNVTYNLTPQTCSTPINGAIDITVNGGQTPYTYSWSTTNGGGLVSGNEDQIDISAGDYSLLITDNRGCTANLNVTVPRISNIQITGDVMPVACYGFATGAINVTSSGMSGIPNYLWTGTGAGLVPNAEDQSGLSAGTYTLTVTDTNLGCSETKTFVVNEPISPVSIDSIFVTDVLCKNENTGEINIYVSGGTSYDPDGVPYYNYTWSGPASFTNSPTQYNLQAGNYQVIAHDAKGCVDTSSIIPITEPAALLGANVDLINDVTFTGGSDGRIEITPVGGSGNYTSIVWSGVDQLNNPVLGLIANSAVQINLIAGTYQAIISDDNGCSYPLTGIVVQEPNMLLNMNIDKKDISCRGSNDGEIRATAFGGVGPYHIRFKNSSGTLLQTVNAASATISGLIPGTYIIEVEDNNGYQISNTIGIVEPALLFVNAWASAHVSCYEGSDGEISLQVAGGTPNAGNYYVRVSGGGSYSNVRTDIQTDNTYTYSGLNIGIYNIEIIDDSDGDGNFNISNDCSTSTTVTINQPHANVVLSGNPQVCEGEIASLTLVTTNWSNIAANPLEVTLSNGAILNVDSYSYIYTYTPVVSELVTITDVSVAGCAKGTYSGAANVIVNDRPTAFIRSNATICEGGSVNAYLDLTGTGPWTVVYFNGNFDVTISNINTTPHQITLSPLATTTYSVRSVADTYCIQTYNVNDPMNTNRITVTVNELPSVTISGNNDICKGSSSNLTFNFNVGSAPYNATYRRTMKGVTDTVTLTNILATPYSYPVTPTDTTLYELITASDANGCSQTVSGNAIITVRPLPGDIGTITGKTLVCQGETNVSYYIEAVDNSTSYQWTLPAGYTITSGASSDSITVDISQTALSGTISVIAKNSCGDSPVSSILVSVNVLPDRAVSITCDQGSQFCQGDKGLIFRTDAVLNATSYQWSVPVGFIIISGQGTSVLSVNLDPNQSGITGDVTVTATNSCGQAAVSDPFIVTINPLPTLNAGFDQNVCSNSTTLPAINPGAGYSGNWTLLSGAASISDVTNPASLVSNLAKDENRFKWTVTNNLTGCQLSDTVSIYNNTLSVNASADENTVCDGATTLRGTTLPTGTTGVWSFSSGGGILLPADTAITTVSNLNPDSNILRWTITKNGCESYGSVEVINNQPSAAIITSIDPVRVCGLDTSLIAANILEGAGMWSIISGSGTLVNPTSPTVNITNLGQGDNVFRWTVTKGICSLSDDITVRNDLLIVNAGMDTSLCENITFLSGSSIPMNVTATSRWYIPSGMGSGSFSNALINDPEVINIGTGDNYFVWEINQNGCLSQDTVVITNNTPSVALVGSNQSICAYNTTISANIPDVGTGYWSMVKGSGVFDNILSTVTGVSQVGEGLNTYRWTIENKDCFSRADINVRNNHVYVFAGKDTAVCDQSTVLNANYPVNGAFGEWSVVPGIGSGTIDHYDDPKTRVGGLSFGNNALVWSINNNGCYSRDTVIITNNTPSVAEAGGDQTINGSTTVMKAKKPTFGDGLWSIVSGGASIADLSDAKTMVSNIQRGSNIFRWTVTHLGCSDNDEVIITNGQAIAAEAGRDQKVCESYADMEANNPEVGIGEWSIVSGSGVFESGNYYKTRVNNLAQGRNVFRWTISYTNSSTSDTVVITNLTPTDASAGPDRTICSDQHTLEANVPSVGEASWTIISGGGVFEDINDPNSLVTSLSKGENVFKYQIINDICPSIDTVKIVNSLPTLPDAGDDEVICVDTTQLIPNNPTFGTGKWSTTGGSEITNNIVRNLDPGPNILIWTTSTASCSLTDTVIIYNNQPSESNAGISRPICEDTVQLSANTPLYGIGRWEKITGTGVIDNHLEPRTIVRNISKGSNRFRWVIDNNGCKSISDVDITNNSVESYAGTDQLKNCSDTAVLIANYANPGIGTWGAVGGNGVTEFDNPNNPYTVVRNLQSGQNVLTWTVKNDICESVSQVVVVNNEPTKAYAGENIPVCNSEVTLSANTPSVYTAAYWTRLSGDGVINDVLIPTTHVTNLSFGKNLFRWTIENNECKSFDDVEISSNMIEAVVGDDKQICSSTITLEANNASPGVGTWSVAGGGGLAVFENKNVPNTRVSNLARGRNVLVWSIDNGGCHSSAEVSIYNNLPSKSFAGNDIELCVDSIVLDARPLLSGAIETGTWEFLTGSGVIDDIHDPKSLVSNLANGDNILRWIVDNGECSDFDEVRVLNNQVSIADAVSGFDVCTPTTTLKAVAPEFGTGVWSVVKGAGNIVSPSNAVTSVEYVGLGQNIFRWTISQGQCSSVDEITIVNNNTTISSAGADIKECKDNAILDANMPQSSIEIGTWSCISGSASFVNVNDPKTKAYNLSFGENVLVWTIANGVGCSSVDQVSVFNQMPDMAIAGIDEIVCDYSVALNANKPVSGVGTWSVVSGYGNFEDPGQNNTRVNDIGFGKNVYKWSISYGECVNEDEIVFEGIKARPFAGEDATVYNPEYIMLAGNPGVSTGTWSVVGGSGIFDDLNNYNSQVSGLEQGINTFRWTIVTSGCSAFDDVSITYKKSPNAGFSVSESSGCYPLMVHFFNTTTGGVISCNWDFGDGVTSSEYSPSYTYTNPGRYNVVLTVPGPDATVIEYSEVIEVYDHPDALFEFTPNTVYIPEDDVRCYNRSDGGIQYFWEFGDGGSSVEENPKYKYETEGTYDISLLVTNEYGCKDQYVINDAVTVIEQGSIKFPNAFMPRTSVSEEGRLSNLPDNAIFKPIIAVDIDDYHLQIFNRWGQLIFESTQVDNGWDGYFNGQLSPQGVYVFKAWGRFVSGKEFSKAGSVMLVR